MFALKTKVVGNKFLTLCPKTAEDNSAQYIHLWKRYNIKFQISELEEFVYTKGVAQSNENDSVILLLCRVLNFA